MKKHNPIQIGTYMLKKFIEIALSKEFLSEEQVMMIIDDMKAEAGK